MADVLLPLNTGAKIPALGLGTWQSEPGQVKNAVLHALKVGYRHIDCAYIYSNESEVGEAFQEAFAAGIVKRKDLFVTTKLWCTFHNKVPEGLDISLKRLGLDYVDLYLMHWPVPMNPNGNHPNAPRHEDGSRDLLSNWSHLNTWAELSKLPITGKVRAIGICNYSVKFLKELLDSNPSIVPAANQIENHPFLPQNDVIEFCKSKGIHVTAYSPLGTSGAPLMQEDAVQEVANKRGVSAGCVLLSFHLARGSSVIPKSVTPSRIEENMKIVLLDESDLANLEGITKSKPVQRFVCPDFSIDLAFPDKSSSVKANA
ncbi:MAG: hypothetical protein M1831_001459 [Alyxoria varia]|nr:MAG: hypothetical protein M1831_001459 [Alyxoria varia]